MRIQFSTIRIGNNVVVTSNIGMSGPKVLYATKTFHNKRIDLVMAKTSGASITVAGGSTEHKVEVYVSANNGSTLTINQIQTRLDKHYILIVQMIDGGLIASASQTNANLKRRKRLNIGFKIYVPEKVSTHLRTSGGNITLRNLTGSLHDFKTSGGNLNVDRLSGEIQGKTSGGNINLSNSKDDIDLSTSGGDVNVTNCSGRLQLSTSGGNVELDRLEGTIDARTSGGNVRADTINGCLTASTSGGDLNLKRISGSLDARSSGGNISVSMTEITADTKVTSSGGNVNVRLPSNANFYLNVFAMNLITSGLGRNFGRISRTTTRGKVNGGGASVNVKGDNVCIQLV